MQINGYNQHNDAQKALDEWLFLKDSLEDTCHMV